MSKLTVLQVAHDHPDWTPAGTEIVARDLARALDARPDAAARLLVAATALQRPEAAPGSLGALGPDYVIRTGPYDRFTMSRLDGTAWIDSLSTVLAETRPDIVHLHGIDRLGAEIVPVLRRLAPAARLVMTLHDYQPICANDGLLLTPQENARCHGASADACRRCFPEQTAARHALRRAHLLACLRGIDLFLAPSAFLRDRFVAWGLEPARLRLLPNAVAIPAPAVAETRKSRSRFAFFGTLARHKGVLVLLDAAARLARAGDDVSVTLHGGLGWADAAFRADFADRLEAALPVAQHLGPYHRSEVAALMQAADWVVVPSVWWENAPLVLEEARAAGRPVIVSGIGGMAERVAHGIDGLHVPPGDAAALADTMRTAADPALWRRLAGVRRAADHDAFVSSHLALYRDLLARVPA